MSLRISNFSIERCRSSGKKFKKHKNFSVQDIHKVCYIQFLYI
ncbi:hypothetical protein X975_17827, partial [Stegodyphus mimosarum]